MKILSDSRYCLLPFPYSLSLQNIALYIEIEILGTDCFNNVLVMLYYLQNYKSSPRIRM